MAELITTQQEKNDASYLDWDDAALGRAVKHAAVCSQNAIKDQSGLKRLEISGAALLIGVSMRNSNAAQFKQEIDIISQGESEPWGTLTIKAELTRND